MVSVCEIVCEMPSVANVTGEWPWLDARGYSPQPGDKGDDGKGEGWRRPSLSEPAEGGSRSGGAELGRITLRMAESGGRGPWSRARASGAIGGCGAPHDR